MDKVLDECDIDEGKISLRKEGRHNIAYVMLTKDQAMLVGIEC